MEKFLFYRGLGTFELPLQVTSGYLRVGEQVKLHNRSADTLRGLFVVRVEKDTIQIAALPALPGGASHYYCDSQFDVTGKLPFSPKRSLKDGVPQAKEAVAAALVEAGLYPKEAQAMVNTWDKSYFRTEGLRVLYILPRLQVDEIIPLRIKPAPQEVVRVMVGRVEVLTPGAEGRILQAVADSGSKDAAVAKAAKAELDRLGRLQGPVLHRIAAQTKDPEIRVQAEALIKTATVKQ
jgi:hypothetical protein